MEMTCFDRSFLFCSWKVGLTWLADLMHVSVLFLGDNGRFLFLCWRFLCWTPYTPFKEECCQIERFLACECENSETRGLGIVSY